VLIIARECSAVIADLSCKTEGSLLLGLFRCHQAQVGGGADLSRVDKTNVLERR